MAQPVTGQVVLDGIPLLVEPNTYSKGEDPLYGRTPVRLDSPINLSPVSTFRQASFLGGMGQDKWDDEEMYYLGDADTRFGHAQCKFRLDLGPGTGGDDRHKNVAVRPQAAGVLPRIYFAGDQTATLKRWNFQTGQVVNAHTFATSTISALGRSFTASQYGLRIGMQNGDLWTIPHDSETVESESRFQDVDSPITFINSLGARGDIAGAGNGTLWKSTGLQEWTNFAKVDMPVYDGEPWNQRLWIVGHDAAQRSCLYVTDTVTTQEVFRWDSAFEARGIQLHSGQLYILGWAYNDIDTQGATNEFQGRIGQMWAYNGASMRLIFQVPDEIWEPTGFTYHGFYDATSHRKWLAFTMPHKGVWFYDPEQDAIHPGPSHQNPQVDNLDLPTNVLDFGGRLITFIYNQQSPRFQPKPVTYLSSYLMTSEYDAGLPAQRKVWLRARVRLKEPLPTGSAVQLYYTTQHTELDNTTAAPWVSLGLVSAGQTTVTLDFPGPTNQPISETIRLQLRITPGTNGATTPRVEAIELDYMVVGDVKWSWNFQAIGGRQLRRPDGMEYEFADASEVQAELEAAKRNSAKKWVGYIDKDGQTYNVQIISLTTYYRGGLDDRNRDGETAFFVLTLGEV